jgi:hypothetical protein
MIFPAAKLCFVTLAPDDTGQGQRSQAKIAAIYHRQSGIVVLGCSFIAGLMLQQNSLEEMASLYSQANNQDKLRQVQDEIKRVEAAIKSFKRA